MLFNSLAYLIFLPVVVGLYWACPKRFRPILLLVASYFFYMYWKPSYGILILALTAFNYVCGLLIARADSKRKVLFALGLVGNLVTLIFFKYLSFLVETANSALSLSGLNKPLSLPFEILLPLGISFFVFEFIHYLTDIFRGSAPVKSFINFALFPSFFPTQIAGPIKRYQDFVPQLSEDKKFSISALNEGMELILFGLFKKICLADTIAVVADKAYAHPDLLNGADCWLVTWAFFFQIYFDFSGYTDVARGSALLLGFKVPQNFDLPLMAGSITDYWRRWHMSLSSWLKDYLFIPLGGSRYGQIFTLRNMLITMALSGLWHGASMHFVVWGFAHGILMGVHRVWTDATKDILWLEKAKKSAIYHYLAVFVTFNSFCWVFPLFRATDMSSALLMIKKMTLAVVQFSWAPSILGTDSSPVFALLPYILAVFLLAQIVLDLMRRQVGAHMSFAWLNLKPVKAAYLMLLLLAILVTSPDSTPAYVYFQF